MIAPAGYERLLFPHAVAVARSDIAASVRRSLVSADGTRATLYEYAASQPSSRLLHGRGAAYAVTLAGGRGGGGPRVVVRHNRHGGAFARFTGDRFFSPTRAPYELDTSLRLHELGVPTTDIVAYVVYPPGGILQRADVASREIPESHDLASILVGSSAAERGAAVAAAARLVGALARAGARHHDLNAKNILVRADQAFVLDVDRVTLGGAPASTLDANLARLTRSLRKWREQFSARISDQEIDGLESSARVAMLA